MTSYLGEKGYLDLLEDCSKRGDVNYGRNGKTVSLFAPQLRFDLTEGFPLLTSKKMFTRGIIEELIWFLNGRTDNRILREKGVHIWDGNTTREFLDSRGLNDYREDECGPIYGFQWRRFNCSYGGCEQPVSDVTVAKPQQDQFAEVIRLIREEPSSRRIIMSGWNPCQLDEMCLPPCHVLYQFIVRERDGVKYISLHMFQRSGDLFLGVPFNIASCAFLIHIVANMTDCVPHELVISLTDAHIYQEHFDAVATQLARKDDLFDYPTLKINKKISLENIGELEAKDFVIEGYQSHGTIRAPMIA